MMEYFLGVMRMRPYFLVREPSGLKQPVSLCLTWLGVILLSVMLAGCGRTSYSVDEYLARGMDFEARGDLAAAVIEYKNALQQEPASAEARFRLGMALLEQGDAVGARQELDRARRQAWPEEQVLVPWLRSGLVQGQYGWVLDNSRHVDDLPAVPGAQVLAIRGGALFGMGNLGGARELFNAALKVQPDVLDAQLGLALVAFNLGEGEEGVRHWLEQALETAPDSAEAWELWGDLERSLGRLDEAVSAYGKAIELSRFPFLLHVKRAIARHAQEDHAGMQADLRSMKRLSPNHPATGYVEGLMFYEQGQYGAAQSAFERSLSAGDGFDPAVFFLGATHFALGNREQSEHYLRRYLSAYPHSDEAARLLAMVRLQEGDLDRAEGLLRSVLGRSQDDVLALNLMGNIFMSRGQFAEGTDYLRQLTRIRPDDLQARARLAEGLLLSGQTEEGLRELRSIIEQVPDAYRLEAVYALNLIQTGRFDEALEAAGSLKASLPDNPLAYNLEAMVGLGRGDMDLARSALREALDRLPGEPVTTSNLAAIEWGLGNTDEAARLYGEGLKHNPGHTALSLRLSRLKAIRGEVAEGVAVLEAAVAAHPEALEPRLVLGGYHLREGMPQRAAEVLQPARDSGSTDTRLLELLASAQLESGAGGQAITTLRLLSAQPLADADAWHRLGYRFELAGGVDDARVAYGRALELSPGHVGALPNLALLELKSGRGDEALRVARVMQGQDGLAAAGHAVEGRAHAMAQRWDEAATAFDRAYGLNPAANHAMSLSQALLVAGRVTEGVEVLRRHLERVPEDATVRNHLAETYLLLGAVDEAIAQYETLRRLQPENPLLLNNLAYLYFGTGNDRAVEYAEQAHALATENPAITHTLGWILVNRDDPERGLALLEEARHAVPERPDVRYHYAVALEKAGRRSQARRELEALLSGVPEFPQREEAAALMERIR
ncbi:hypothetical protein CKO35_05950 [Ectothiorhodospira shaposhnikovii]|uniref:XrtA/PEP-CTERM system TPR-repeat protein PrsT n=1 Tax=Ectothiorhodospira shaposhnikovii TaxID=1054 RepID=UPI0019045440|nr:XrtA/PEP-CTERM system TPR-repeat protein PrsT [Ectothiorhodospira shaposhnikovii]MBK1672852.1 hypothetical protein [Ectothiorhodospira shaposhnikovii]